MKKNSNDTEKKIQNIFEVFLSGSENPRRKEDGEIIIEEGLANYILCVPRFFYDMVFKMLQEEGKRLINRYGKMVKQIAEYNKEGILFCDESSRKSMKLEKSYDNVTKILSSVKLPPNINIIDFLNLLKITAREMQYSDDVEISDVNYEDKSITNSRTTVASKSQNIINRVETALNIIYDIQEEAKRIEDEQKRANIAQRENEARMSRQAEKRRYEEQKKPKYKTKEQIWQEKIDDYIAKHNVYPNSIMSILDFIGESNSDIKCSNKELSCIATDAVKQVINGIKPEQCELFVSDFLKVCAQVKDPSIKRKLETLLEEIPEDKRFDRLRDLSEMLELL